VLVVDQKGWREMSRRDPVALAGLQVRGRGGGFRSWVGEV
jgi:hypothetical protein